MTRSLATTLNVVSLYAVALVLISAALPAYSQALFIGWGVPQALA